MMLKTFATISAVAGVMVVMTGCATKGQIQEMSDRVAAAESRLSQVESTASQALKESSNAHEHAYRAEKLAQECHEMCQAQSAKLDRLFHRSMMK